MIPISLFKMEITAIRFSRHPLIKINGNEGGNKKWEHRQAILPFGELGGWGQGCVGVLV